ncbi:MAG: hypothetical protein R3C15_14850 [Thermoleophilia bacterium]
MATIEVEHAEQAVETEAERVFRWRREELRRAGYDDRAAFKLALRPNVDLHRAVALLERGCPPELAERILL